MGTISRRRRTVLGVAVMVGFAWAAVAGPLQVDATVGVDADILDLERSTLDLVRTIVPFDGAAVAEDGDRLVVSLDADVLFDFDAATLTPQAENTLAELATQIDDRLAGNDILVTGHTDAKGTTEYNVDLSQRRAEAVRDHLAEQLERAVTFTVDGRGEADPVAPNENDDGSDNPDGRRRNRRVELSFDVLPPDGG